MEMGIKVERTERKDSSLCTLPLDSQDRNPSILLIVSIGSLTLLAMNSDNCSIILQTWREVSLSNSQS